jgi:hypothetical protein
MSKCFIPVEARPTVAQDLVCEAWAVAEALESCASRGAETRVGLNAEVDKDVTRPSPSQ